MPGARQRRRRPDRPAARAGTRDVWTVRIAPADDERRSSGSGRSGELVAAPREAPPGADGEHAAISTSGPRPGSRPLDLERALGARRGGLEVLSLGRRLDLVKQVGSPAELEAAYGVSSWSGPLAIGHTRMSTESRIDLCHSQPFWAHGVPDLATVHNGHVTNYHQLRRRYEQKGVTFYTDNDSEVIGVYLRERMLAGPKPPRGPRRLDRRPRRCVQLPGRLVRGAGDRPRPIRIQAA